MTLWNLGNLVVKWGRGCCWWFNNERISWIWLYWIRWKYLSFVFRIWRNFQSTPNFRGHLSRSKQIFWRNDGFTTRRRGREEDWMEGKGGGVRIRACSNISLKTMELLTFWYVVAKHYIMQLQETSETSSRILLEKVLVKNRSSNKILKSKINCFHY